METAAAATAATGRRGARDRELAGRRLRELAAQLDLHRGFANVAEVGVVEGEMDVGGLSDWHSLVPVWWPAIKPRRPLIFLAIRMGAGRLATDSLCRGVEVGVWLGSARLGSARLAVIA